MNKAVSLVFNTGLLVTPIAISRTQEKMNNPAASSGVSEEN